MALTPGAATAFKPPKQSAKPAAASGVAPVQVGGVKFPGKINPKLAASILPPVSQMAGGLPAKTAGMREAAIGASIAAVFGKIISSVPVLGKFLTKNPMMHDAVLGAAIAEVIHRQAQPAPAADDKTPEEEDGANAWKLQ
jgi:hypothetical protein